MVGNNIWITENCNKINRETNQEYPQYNDMTPEKAINKVWSSGDQAEPFQKHSARLINHLSLSHNSNGYMDDVSNKNREALRLSLRNVLALLFLN